MNAADWVQCDSLDLKAPVYSGVRHDAPTPWPGPFDAMRFPLSYEGSLPSSGNPRDPSKPSKLKEIWAIRNAVHLQIRSIYDHHSAFRGQFGHSNALLQRINLPIVVDGRNFYPLARVSFKLKCELEIEMLVNHPIASVVTNGSDLDNRLKTLFDGLRVPQSVQEIKGYMPPDITDYCCLLENDVIISALKIEAFRNTATPAGAPLDHVRLNMRVRLEPMEYDFVNEPFRHD